MAGVWGVVLYVHQSVRSSGLYRVIVFLGFFSCFVVVVTVLVLIDMVPVKEIMGIGVNLGRKGSTYRYHHHHHYFGSP